MAIFNYFVQKMTLYFDFGYFENFWAIFVFIVPAFPPWVNGLFSFLKTDKTGYFRTLTLKSLRLEKMNNVKNARKYVLMLCLDKNISEFSN